MEFKATLNRDRDLACIFEVLRFGHMQGLLLMYCKQCPYRYMALTEPRDNVISNWQCL